VLPPGENDLATPSQRTSTRRDRPTLTRLIFGMRSCLAVVDRTRCDQPLLDLVQRRTTEVPVTEKKAHFSRGQQLVCCRGHPLVATSTTKVQENAPDPQLAQCLAVTVRPQLQHLLYVRPVRIGILLAWWAITATFTP
jgi:hypothetical protein